MKGCAQKVSGNGRNDPLTGLPNRALFHDRLSKALAFSRRDEALVAVLFVGVHNIKTINDTLGQSYGDRLLKAISVQIKGCLRRSDTVARPGRNEFMVMLPKIASAEDAALVARKIFASLEAPFLVGKHELLLSASIGISLFPCDGGDAVSVIKNAYTAMQRALNAGKSTCVFYSPDMSVKAFDRMMLENSLRLALRRREFFLHYQPQIDLRTGTISGMEALVRWNRPGSGTVSPTDFIHLMEEAGLIADLGEWVLRSACAQNRRWQDSGLKPVRIAVNLSALQFQRHDIVKTVGRVLDETGLEPRYLELELTESIFIGNAERTVDSLYALRDLGVHLSIDDFGTGYSSLCYLRSFPVSRLKIVAPFISSIAINTNDLVVAGGIVSMAHSLNVKVIAEGVEGMEDLEFIYSLKCDEVQGHIFSGAVCADTGREFLSGAKLFSPLAFA
ncbi:MAG TPA: EAL domain-containing protein [Thermodesulfovibrionales bacterium]|nr:EAL domain-containing protein [Thermodesulfovibrionales bacterium]